MAENSRSKVTITLGHGRQVVKKAGLALDISVGDSESIVQRKRSIRDRLGGDIEISMAKRPRGDARERILRASNCVDDMVLCEDDLRFKIMQKKMLKKAQIDDQRNQIDLRNLLSRPAQSSTTSVGEQQHVPEKKDAKNRLPDPRDSREYMSELKDPRLRIPEFRDARQYTQLEDPRLHKSEVTDGRQYTQLEDPRLHASGVRDQRPRIAEDRASRQRIAEIEDSRQRMAETIGSRQRIADVRDSRQRVADVSGLSEVRHSNQYMQEAKSVGQHLPDPYSLSVTGRIPSTTVTGSLTRIDPLKSSYSPWSVEGIRRRSPDGVVSSSRGLSPPRREEELRRPSVGSYDNSRMSSYLGKDVVEFSRPLSSTSYMATAALPSGSGPSKLMGPPLPPHPPSSLLQRSSYAVDEQLTVDRFLYSLGLEKFAINFIAEEVDMYALKQMGDSDLKDLGIPMGPRRKILLALQPRAKRPV